MEGRKFAPRKKGLLDDPERLAFLNPEAIWWAWALERPETLVDIGAGTGFFAIPFSHMMAGGVVYACDISGEMLEALRQNLLRYPHGDVRPLKMDENRVPLPDESADLVYLINVYHELDSPPLMLREARRLLKGGGTLAVIDWKKEPTPHGPPVSHRVSSDVIRSTMLDGGFSGIAEKDLLPYSCFLTGRK